MKRDRLLLLALHSDLYPAIGETHGLSVIAGCVESTFPDDIIELRVVDMVGLIGDREETVLHTAEELRPTILGISTTYGSYDCLQRLYPELLKRCVATPLIILGGVLATYIPDKLLTEIAPDAVIVCGEGDESFVAVINAWRQSESFSAIPNLMWKAGELITRNPRKLVDTTCVPAPSRKHVAQLYQRGAQLFVESSRGCSWAACTFCLRGLTDVDGKAREYRRFRPERLAQDVSTLAHMGVSSVTFADEDFLGGSTDQVESVLGEVCSVTRTHAVSFDASLTIRSVFSERRSLEENERRKQLLIRAKQSGMRKIFLGIESGSPSQLKRYAKGHTVNEATRSAEIVRGAGILLEIGFIMFDPLCTLEEIFENIRFLKANSLTGAASSVCNELRLQTNSRYLEKLVQHERNSGEKLSDCDLEPNTLAYAYRYKNALVEQLVGTVRRWNRDMRPLHYRLKNLSRYGHGGILGELTEPVRLLVRKLREEFLIEVEHAAESCSNAGMVTDNIEMEFQERLKTWSGSAEGLFQSAPEAIRAESIVQELLQVASRLH